MIGHVQNTRTFRYTGVLADDRNTIEAQNVQTQSRSHATSVVLWSVAGAIVTLLILRFVFMLLGINQNYQFVNIIYTVSTPFVIPFFDLFGYTAQYDVSSFEYSTLTAIIAYGSVTWGLTRLFTIGRSHY